MGDEQTLLNGLRDLDPQVITQIHDTSFPTLFRYARYKVGDDAVAEDLVSEAFVRLLESIHAGKGPRASLHGWLIGTVSNLANDYFRKVYNNPVEFLRDNAPATNGNPASLSETSNRREMLRAALSRLTPEQQHVLALRFGSGCSLAETAEIMDKKPNAIKQLQFRALAALRQNIAGEL